MTPIRWSRTFSALVLAATLSIVLFAQEPDSDGLLEAEVASLVENYLAQRQSEESWDPRRVEARWEHGMQFYTADEAFRFHVGGRYQLDTAWFDVPTNVQQNINNPYGDGIAFRRARFTMDGTVYRIIDWAAEIDFVNSFRAARHPASISEPDFVENTTVALTDFWWQVDDIPFFGRIRVGQQKDPIGMEHLVSSRFLPFMERSFNQDVFYGGTFNGFVPGISAARNFGSHDRGLIHYGIFKPIDNVFGYSTGTGDYSAVARLSGLLRDEDHGRRLLHLGGSFKQSTTVRQAAREGRLQTYRTRDAVRSGLSQDWPVPAGIVLFGKDFQQVNAEFAAVRGPWTLQGEYLVNWHQDARLDLASAPSGVVVYHGGYLQLLCFLTGENDRYDRRRGAFERVIPNRNLVAGRDGFGGGAWQVGARYNFLDLNDAGFNGGLLHNQTYGLNWFLNPNMKAQLNYSATYRDVSLTRNHPDGNGWIHGLGTRIAFDY